MIVINIKELECFLAVVDAGSITSAAPNIYISPQGLSTLLKKFETEVGVSLFDRKNNGVSINEYGKIVADKAAEILELYREMQNQINDLKRLQNGMIRMVSAYGVLRRLTPEFIFKFSELNPEINLDYMEFPDKYIDDIIWNEKADIGFSIGDVNDEKFDKTLIYEEDIMLLVPANSEFSNKETVSFLDISNCDFVIESNMFKLHNTFIKKCNKYGFQPNILFNTSGFGLCHKLCSEGKGLSLSLKSNCSDMLNLGLKLIPFDEEFKWQVYMITKKYKKTNNTVEILKKHTLNWKI